MLNPKHLLLAAALSAIGAAHAGDVPYEASFPSASQQKAMSVQHWTVIADDLVNSVLSTLGAEAKTGLHFTAGPQATPFERHLVEFMIDSAVNKGVPVLSNPRQAQLVVDVSTLVATHASRASAQTLPATMLAAGVLVLREIALENWKLALLTGGLMSDVGGKAAKPPTRSEIAVTVSVQDRGLYVARKSNVYYVETVDVGLFRPRPGRLFQVEAAK